MSDARPHPDDPIGTAAGRSWERLWERTCFAVLIVDAAGVVRSANRSSHAVTGHHPDDLVGRHVDVLGLGSRQRRRTPTRADTGAVADLLPEPVRTCWIDHADGRRINIALEVVDLGEGRPSTTLEPGDGVPVGLIFRDMSATRRRLDKITVTNQLLATMHSSASIADAAAELARTVTLADACSVRLTDPTGQLRVRHADSGHHDFDTLAETLLAERTASGSATGHDVELLIGPATGHPDWHHVSIAPVRVDAEPVGHIVCGFRSGRSVQHHDLVEDTGDCATIVSFALGLVGAREELDRLKWLSDHDRIARDLHDTVIQRLFATAMRLEAALPGSDPVTAQRVSAAVDDLDTVIRDIRTAIFDLHRPATSRGGLRAEVAAEIDEFAEAVGFRPRLEFDGVIDGAAIDPPVAHTVVNVVRELLANVAKHARATSIDVTLRTTDGGLAIEVRDDGIGPAPHHDGRHDGHQDSRWSGGDGLTNLDHRAQQFGGTFEIAPHRDGGTAVRWFVPLDGQNRMGGTPVTDSLHAD